MVEDGSKEITPNNKAFMLTILEDNWDVWTSEATLQLKQSIKALDPIWYGDMNVEKEQVSEQVDKYRYSGRMGKNR